MAQIPESLERLIAELERLPGIGPRSAARLAHHLLRVSEPQALELADAIRTVRERIRPCSLCRAPSESDPCALCTDEGRDTSLLLVVESARDMAAVEASGAYKGLYFVLGGKLSPLEGVGAEALDLEALVARIARTDVREVCLGMNPDLEGDGTALAVVDALRSAEIRSAQMRSSGRTMDAESAASTSASRLSAVRVTRLARGLPTGGQIEHQSASAVADAFEGRRALD